MSIRRLLWIDFIMGGVNGILGIIFCNFLRALFEIPSNIIMMISVVTLLYALVACILAQGKTLNVKLTKALILANWIWVLVSLVLIYLFIAEASVLGRVFLLLQVIVVGGLAYLEGRALKNTSQATASLKN
jgi:uncharacterized protein with PQ loop repeat